MAKNPKKSMADQIAEELCSVQPLHNDEKVVDAINTIWDITVNQKKTIEIKFDKKTKEK